MSALLTFPGARVITVRNLTPRERAAEIERLATCVRGVSRFATEVLLSAVARDTLRGDALWQAWQHAAQTIAARDATSRADPEYPARVAEAAAAVGDVTGDTTYAQKAGA